MPLVLYGITRQHPYAHLIPIIGSLHSQAVTLARPVLTAVFSADSAPAPAPQKPAASKSVGGPSQARPAKHAHPLQTLGGYQMPVHGKIGGQKGVGAVEPTSQASVKRKRDDTGEAYIAGSLHTADAKCQVPWKPQYHCTLLCMACIRR